MEIALVLGLLFVAIVLFATEQLSVDVITLLLVSALVLTGVLSPAEAFAGPPERLSSVHQESLHQLTVVGGDAEATVLSPSTNAPLLGKAKTIAVLLASEEAR